MGVRVRSVNTLCGAWNSSGAAACSRMGPMAGTVGRTERVECDRVRSTTLHVCIECSQTWPTGCALSFPASPKPPCAEPTTYALYPRLFLRPRAFSNLRPLART